MEGAAAGVAGPRLLMQAIICRRIGSGNAAQVGIPVGKWPFRNSQKISPSVARDRFASLAVSRAPWHPLCDIWRSGLQTRVLRRRSPPVDQQKDSHGCGLLPAGVSTTPHPRPGIPSRRTTGSLVRRTCMFAWYVSAFARTPPKIAEDLFDFVTNPESPEKPDATCAQAKTRLGSDGGTLGALN